MTSSILRGNLGQAYDKHGYIVLPVGSIGHQFIASCIAAHFENSRLCGSHHSTANTTLDEIKALVDSGCSNTSVSRDDRTMKMDPCVIYMNLVKPIEDFFSVSFSRFHLNDFYYRVVRNDEDLSKVHRDEWYHQTKKGWSQHPDLHSLKMWIPVHCTDTPVIGVIPGSHRDKDDGCEIRIAESGGSESSWFDICNEISNTDLTPVSVPVGSALLFGPRLLHGGLPHRSPTPRVSAELTLLFNK